MITTVIAIGAVAVGLLLVFASLMQRAYQESQRLRLNDASFLAAFQEHLEDRIGVKTEEGAMAFSLAKHTLLVMLVAMVDLLSVNVEVEQVTWAMLLQSFLTALVAMFVCVYLLPPLLFRRVSGRWIGAFTPLAWAMIWLFRPLQYFLDFFESLASIGKESNGGDDANSQEEHFEAFMEAGEEEGLIEEEDRKLIRSVVEFGDKTVREVMTPRTNMICVAADRNLDELRQLVIQSHVSRVPVYETDIDNIIGFVHVRDVFEIDDKDLPNRSVRELARTVRLVPESKPVSALLREMQSDGTHLVIVINEYGDTAGLATLEDLMEEIFGEIRDEHENEDDVTMETPGVYVVSGSVDVDRLEELIGYRAESDSEATTVGGLISEWAGHVPRVGEIVEEDGISMEVTAGNELRVETVRIRRVPTPAVNGESNSVQ